MSEEDKWGALGHSQGVRAKCRMDSLWNKMAEWITKANNNKPSWCPWLWLWKPYEGALFSCYTPPCFSGTGSNLPLPEFPILLPLITSWRVMKHFKFCVKLTGGDEVEKGGLWDIGWRLWDAFEQGPGVGMWHPKAQPWGQDAAAAVFRWDIPAPFNASSSSFLKFSLVPLWLTCGNSGLRRHKGAGRREISSQPRTHCPPTGRARGEF